MEKKKVKLLRLISWIGIVVLIGALLFLVAKMINVPLSVFLQPKFSIFYGYLGVILLFLLILKARGGGGGMRGGTT